MYLNKKTRRKMTTWESDNWQFIWEIPEISWRTQEPKSMRTISLHSAQFYTSWFGYKLYLRLYLDGDGKLKIVHTYIMFNIFYPIHWGSTSKLHYNPLLLKTIVTEVLSVTLKLLEYVFLVIIALKLQICHGAFSIIVIIFTGYYVCK